MAWRWALISKRVPREVDSHLPFGQGLILGRFRIYGPDGCCSRWVSDVHGTGEAASPPKDLHVAVSDGKPRAFFEFVGGTILHDDNLRLDQADYRDAMNALVERHSGALARLREAATWRVAGNQPTPGFDDLRAELDAVADGIAAIVAHPRLGAVVAPRTQEAPADASAWVQPR